jgi:multidrug efflux system outer membrane protein
MSKSKIFRLMALGVAGLMLQACGIPELTIKKEDTHLPDSYKPSLSEKTNTANIKWKDFFEDPNLLNLIDTAVANNKEINIMMQRISVAQNEIQARKGMYLPFVSIGAEAGGDKVGKYTRSGAVEDSLTLANGQPFPTFLGDYQFGLFSTWEIDIWKKLRNATQVAVL